MPARLSSMELSPSSNPSVDPSSRPSRTKSGRATKRPEVLSPSSSTKRKRGAASAISENDSNLDSDAENSEQQDANEDDPDEEELREQRRKKRVSGAKSKPASKRSRPNTATALPIRGAKARPITKAKSRASQRVKAAGDGGLYERVYDGEESLEDVAAEWMERFAAHESNALAEVVNFVLRCAGCEQEVTAVDIEDPDNCTSRLTDIQEEFQSQRLSDYPLIAKGKAALQFRRNMTGFINVLVKSIAAKGLLFDEPALIENIQIWVVTMSSAANRPFRHTSTVLCLEIINAFCTLGREFVDNRAKILRQAEGEQRSKKVNNTRVDEMQKRAQAAAEHKTQIDSMIKDWFDVVFVHRYRDIDPRIRVDSVTYLSEWIWTYPEQFLDGQHLRYLGWVLSDTSAPTRQEVARRLQRIFKDDSKIAGLRQFTERFRPRMVEMAMGDGEINVRRTTIELLQILRDKGLLEPDDIDTIGKLIFDVDARIRKTVVPFFIASIEELYEAKVENFDPELLQDFAANSSESGDATRLEWVRFKALAELLQAYGADEDEASPKTESGTLDGFLPTSDSRMSLAAQAVYDHVPVLRNWEALAACLATDHSGEAKEIADDIESQIRHECKLDEKEEIILLDVLNVAVKASLTEMVDQAGAKKVKRTKAQVQALREQQEGAAQQLATWIPRLLKKFGSISEATSAVLRLEHVLNLEVFHDLRQDNTTFATLLEDINHQFLSHEASDVLQEVKVVLLHAMSFEELHEVTDDKVQALWDDTILTFARLCRGEDMTTRGNLHVTALSAMSSTALRIANLSSIADGTTILETPRTINSNTQRRKVTQVPPVVPIDCLVNIVGRGVPGAAADDETDAAENTLISVTLRCLFFYFSWKIVALRAGTSSLRSETALTHLASFSATLCRHLVAVLFARHGADPIRLQAAGLLLDLKALFSTLKMVPGVTSAFDGAEAGLSTLSRVDASTQRLIMKVYAAAERDYAQKAGKSIYAGTAETQAGAGTQQARDAITDSDSDDLMQDPTMADPVSSDDEVADGLDEDDVVGAGIDDAALRRKEARQQRKQRTVLLAEQGLCMLAGKVVLAIAGKALPDEAGVKARLRRNVGKLGPNFKDVVGMLEAKPAGAGKKGRKDLNNGVAIAKKINVGRSTAKAKSRAIVSSDEEDGDDGGVPLEEDAEQDLRDRELLHEDPIELDDAVAGKEDEVESVLGD